jgi:hypothetical protein
MSLSGSVKTILFSMLLLVMMTSSQQLMAQGTSDAPAPAQRERREDDTNLDTQLYLLVGTNQDVDDAKLPAALDSVLKQLRASLPFKNYRLTATLLNRVKADGRLNLRWVGGPMIGSTAATAMTPSFNDFKVNQVKLVTDSAGRPMVRMEGFGFGVRIPIQTMQVASTGPGVPVTNYEPTGLNTDISMLEGEPVIVGTLNIGPSGDAIILVMSAKRTRP